MPLKIFISSVSRDLDESKKALQAEIISLQNLFSSMEYFGSDPLTPAEYCIREVQSSNLYIGLIGARYGSVEEKSQISYTRLEYRTAKKASIPCLIYFSDVIFKARGEFAPEVDEHQKEFIDELKPLASVFGSPESLKISFLRDFIRLLQTGQFAAQILPQPGPLPAEVLHSITRSILPQQIKSVGQEKYIPDIYIPRQSESVIAGFVDFEGEFLAKAAVLIQQLEWAGKKYIDGDGPARALARLEAAVKESRTEEYESALDQIRTVFHFEEVNELLDDVDGVIGAHDIWEARRKMASLLQRLQRSVWLRRHGAIASIDQNLGILFREADRANKSHSAYQDILRILPSFHSDVDGRSDVELCTTLILQLGRLLDKATKNCIILVDGAGSGKTNILCHTAEALDPDNPVILISGRMLPAGEYGIEEYIRQRLELQLAGLFTDWVNRVDSLREQKKWLYILIDGINENGSLHQLSAVLNSFLSRTRHRRIRVVLSCRDLVWDLFRGSVSPWLFREPISIENYSNEEWERAAELYFRKYRIECLPDRDAGIALRNPLLLRFFCVANSGKQLGRVDSIKMVKVFDLYLEQINHSACRRMNLPGGEPALRLLLQLAGQMWKDRSTAVPASLLQGGTSQSDQLYHSILDENIVLEEEVHIYSTDRNVKFLYDEFMEYILARVWLEAVYRSADREKAVDETIRASLSNLDAFPAGFGALLFLDQLYTAGEPVVNRLIKKTFRDSLRLSQLHHIYAFERIVPASLRSDDEPIRALEVLYGQVEDEYKDRLAYIISRLLSAVPNHPFAEKYTAEVLGIEKRGDTVDPWIRTNGEDMVWRLPPAHFRYSEESRLSAIGILIQRGDRQDFEAIRKGIGKIGKEDLDSALRAIGSMDKVESGFLYETLEDFISDTRPEQRLLTAWLLRHRYGSEAAGFVLRLLRDKNSRVHKYMYRLFDRRGIEPGLVDRLLSACADPGIERWHLLHLIRILGKRSQMSPDCDAGIRTRIGATLASLLSHSKGDVRLEAFRSCLQYPEIFGRQRLKEQMLADTDVFVRREGLLTGD